MPTPEDKSSSILEPLKLSERDHAYLGSFIPTADERRRQARTHMTARFRVIVRFDSGTATSAPIRSAASDLSDNGIGIWHSAFIPVGTRCSLSMLDADCRLVSLKGKVVRSEFVSGRAHIIGILFDEPIKASRFTTRRAG